MDGKQNVTESIIAGNVIIGDNNFQQVLNDVKDADIKTSLKELQEAIGNSPDIDQYSKTDATDDLARIAQELSKSEREQDRRAIKHYWDKVIGVVKGVGSVFGVATNLAKILGLPAP
jgi:hypothetical protein